MLLCSLVSENCSSATCHHSEHSSARARVLSSFFNSWDAYGRICHWASYERQLAELPMYHWQGTTLSSAFESPTIHSSTGRFKFLLQRQQHGGPASYHIQELGPLPLGTLSDVWLQSASVPKSPHPTGHSMAPHQMGCGTPLGCEAAA